MKILNLILTGLMLLSCGKGPQKITKSVKEEFYINSTSKSCAKINLYSDILTKKNVQSLFECLKLNNSYPRLFKKLSSIDESEFNSINQIMNETYFKDVNTRNKLLGTIMGKTRKSSSKSLSHLIKSFLSKKTNITSLVNITTAIQNKKIDVSSDFLFKYLKFMADLEANTELGRKMLSTAFHRKETVQNFSNFLQLFLEDVLLGEDEDKKSFILFLQEESWMKSFMSNLSKDSFEKIIFFLVQNPSFLSGVETYKKAINEDSFNCASQSQSYVVDHKVELNWQLENLYKLDIIDFNSEMINLITRFRLYSQICYQDDFNPIVSELLRTFSEFINIDGGFKILKKLAEISLLDDLDNELIVNFFTSNSFKKLNSVLSDLEGEKDFLDGIYLLLKSLKASDYENISNIMKSLEVNPEFVSSFRELWTEELSSSDRRNLVDYVVDMFLTSKDIYPAFDLLNVVVDNLNNESKKFMKLVLSEQINLSGVRDFILEDDLAYEELLQFFEEDSLFSIISLIQKNDLAEDYTLPADDTEEVLSVNSFVEDNCLKVLVNLSSGLTLDEYISKFPDQCLAKTSKKENFAVKIIRWSKSMNVEFQDLFGLDVVSDHGILNKSFMHFLHQMVHITTKYVKSAGDFSKQTVNTVKDFLFEYGYLEDLEKIFESIIEYDKQEKVLIPIMEQTKNISSDEFDSIAKYGLNVVSTFSESKLKYKCRFLHNCSFSIKNFKNIAKKNGLNLDKSNIDKILDGVSSSRYPLEDYIELVRFIGEDGLNNESKVFRIEKILKAVDFKNSYYAIFFMGKMANAKSYKTVVSELKNDFKLATNFSSTLKFMGVFPKDIKTRFKTVNANLEVLDEFNTFVPGKDYKYGDVLIELFKVINELSPKQTRLIRKVSIPREKKVYGHFGHFITALSSMGVLSEFTNYFYVNSSSIIKTKVSFKEIKILLSKLNLKLVDEEIDLNDLPLSKKTFSLLLSTPKETLKNIFGYIDALPDIKLSLRRSNLDLARYNTLFKILSDKDVAYEALHETLIEVYNTDPEYLSKLIEYSLIENNGKTNLEIGLRNMFISSNHSLVNFFKDILAHFKL